MEDLAGHVLAAADTELIVPSEFLGGSFVWSSGGTAVTLTASDLWRLAGESLTPWLRTIPGAEVEVTPHGWLALSGEPVADFNLVYVDEGPAAREQLQAFGRVLQERNLPAVVILARAIADGLTPSAHDLGLQSAGSMPMMVYQPTEAQAMAPDSGRYRVERVANAAGRQAVKRLLASAFQLPPDSVERVLTPAMLDVPGLTLFLTYLESEPVSTVMTTTAGTTVGFWSMATPPERQRQGAGRATMEAVIRYHRQRGAQRFYLGATPPGKLLYDRVGFRTLEETAVWVAGHSTQFSEHASDTPKLDFGHLGR